MALAHHTNTIPVTEFLASITPGQTYIAALASYSPDPDKVNRYSLFLEKENGLEPLKDAWLSKEESAKLPGYGNVILADSDAMYAVGPDVVWYTGKGSFKVYQAGKLTFRADRELVMLGKSGYRVSEITAVHLYLNGWTEFGVKLVLKKEEVLLVKQFNEIASLDITYDGLNLMVDSFWVRMLGKALAEFMGRPCIMDEDLK